MSVAKNPIIDYKYRMIYYGKTLVIKGQYDIKNYDDNIIILKCENDIITLKGAYLKIDSLDVNEIYISGKITDILFS
ncbi:MAG: YabP/YqfC family sporulation protein [Clostridia bacterium]|nr:YabP/YqfC family sporulation protein [Clostridia bacterium]